TGTQTLYMDLTSQPTSLTGHRLLGAGGVPLNSLAPPPGDGQSGATAKGGSGGIGDFAFPSATMTASATVKSHVDATSLSAGGSVSITANSASSVSSYADTTGGGVLSVGKAQATTSYTTAPTEANVAGGTRIVAGDGFTLSADSDHSVSSTAY